MEDYGGDFMREAGVLSEEDVLKVTPPIDRAEKGPVAVLECLEKIPCDACGWACPFGAIIKEGITIPPKIDYEKCTGCGQCVLVCPGLAIFLIELNEEKCRVTIPYELLPEPQIGQEVAALDRKGTPVAKARVLRVLRSKDKTLAVTIEVPRDLFMKVRGIRL
jgi:ferredoxin